VKVTLVNDVHSQLNPINVKEIVSVKSLDELREVTKTASINGAVLCIAGGRHSMGSQQFATEGILIDMSKMNRVLNFDSEMNLFKNQQKQL
jgi:FAD/FMN-containing dehydrogenase